MGVPRPCSAIFSSVMVAGINGVQIGPGATELTRVRGVVDQDVEAAECFDGDGDDRLAPLLTADVTRNGGRLPTGFHHEADGLPGVVLLLGQVADQYIGALARKGDGDGAADAGVPAGDDGLRPVSFPVPW